MIDNDVKLRENLVKKKFESSGQSTIFEDENDQKKYPLLTFDEHGFNLDKAIKSAGDYGLYHIINISFLSLVWVIIPSIPMMIPYFRMMPDFMCEEGGQQRQCTIQEICDNTITKQNPKSPIKTWATDFNMYCEKSYSIFFGVLGSLYFLGVLTGNLFISKFTDKYGRKPTLIFYLIAYLMVSLLTIFAWSYYIFLLVSFSVGVIYSGTSMCAFVLNFESSSKDRKSTFSTILSMSYGFGAIAHIVIFYYFKNWIVTVAITSCLTAVLLIFTFHLQESPEFLYEKGRYTELYEVLRYIAKMNKKSEQFEDYLSRNKITTEIRESKIETINGIYELLGFEEHRQVLLVMAFNWFVMTLCFYGINFNVTNFGTNPYITGILVYLSESLAQWLCLYMILNYGYKKTLCSCYVLAAVSLILINLLSAETHWILKFVTIFFAKFGISGVNICNYIFTAEMFPTLIRVAAMSFCSLMSRFGGMSSTLIIEQNNYSMSLFGILCLISSVLLWENKRILEETGIIK